jgi:hypothetical protein
MAEIALATESVRECVLKLIESARVEIPKIPKRTKGMENFYVKEPFYAGGHEYVLALSLTPSFDGEEPDTVETMCRCAVLAPEAGLKCTLAILYEPIETIIEMLATEEMEKTMMEAFDKLLHEVKEYPPFD